MNNYKHTIICRILIFVFFPTLLSGRIYTLNDCIDMAVRNNLSLRKTRESISLSQAQKLLSYSEMLPYISARSSVNRSSSIFGTEPYTDTYSSDISLNQTVFDLSSIFDIKSSRIDVKESNALYEAAVNEIEYAVAGFFYDLLKKKRLLSVKELGFRESEENLRKTRLMYDIGTVSKVDLLRSEVVKNQSELDLLMAEKDIELSKANLAYIIGLEPALEFDVKEESIEVKDYSINDYDALLERVKEENPEVLAERLSVSSGKAQLSSTYCKFLPKLSLSGSYGYSGDKFTFAKEEWDENDSWSVGASVTLPLFTGFSRSASIKQSKALLKMKELELSDAIAIKGIELKKALLAIDEAEKTFTLAEKNLEKAELGYRMTQEKYNLGAATILELIDAEQDYEQAQVTKISSYFDLLLATFYVTNLLGERIVD
ncbi:Outer membrane efflux protein BepC [subsurface metagenome]